MDVLKKHLEEHLNTTPKPLSLAKSVQLMKSEGLHVNNMLYIVHYPKEGEYKRSENSEHVRVLQGELAKPRLVIETSLCICSLWVIPYSLSLP